MKVLVTGADGLVGSHLIENAKDFDFITPSYKEMDVTDYDSVVKTFEDVQPEVVIHFAAFTDVSGSEKERDDKTGLVWRVNVEGSKNIAKATKKINSFLIHISTDSVFSGHKDNPGPYPEDFPTEENPNLLSWYGWSKREAERVITDLNNNLAIVRISNPARAHYEKKLDYVRKIIALFDQGKLYPMFNDQYLTLTFINEVTKTLEVLTNQKKKGIYHVSSTNLFTPFELANIVIEKARGVKDAVKSSSIVPFLKEHGSRYPQLGGLKTEKTRQTLGLNFLTWEEAVDEITEGIKRS